MGTMPPPMPPLGGFGGFGMGMGMGMGMPSFGSTFPAASFVPPTTYPSYGYAP